MPGMANTKYSLDQVPVKLFLNGVIQNGNRQASMKESQEKKVET